MKTNTIKIKHVYSEKKENTVYFKQKNETWFPINFQWIPVVNLNNELNLKTNKMKNLVILPVVLLLTLISSCSRDTIYGSGDMVSEFRDVDYFTKLSSEGVFDVNITQGTSQSIEIIANDNIIHKVKTRVVNNELKLYLDSDNDTYRDIILQANIVVTRLNGLKNSGTGNIYAYNIEEEGSFSIGNSGTADITAEGSASSLNAKNEGSGEIFGFDFFVEDCSIDIEGSGSVEISCSENLDVDIEGSGNVYYKGNPTIDTTISGSGSVLNEN